MTEIFKIIVFLFPIPFSQTRIYEIFWQARPKLLCKCVFRPQYRPGTEYSVYLTWSKQRGYISVPTFINLAPVISNAPCPICIASLDKVNALIEKMYFCLYHYSNPKNWIQFFFWCLKCTRFIDRKVGHHHNHCHPIPSRIFPCLLMLQSNASYILLMFYYLLFPKCWLWHYMEDKKWKKNMFSSQQIRN